jgi:GAF domain-containing protein
MTPDRESARTSVLKELDMEELRSDPAFARVSDLVARICDAEMSSLALMQDEQYCFLASNGLGDATTLLRDLTFCTYTMSDGDMMIVEDLADNPRFAEHPLVEDDDWDVRFYAGATLLLESVPVGTLCVLDSETKLLDADSRNVLLRLVHQLENHLGMLYRYDVPDDLQDVLSRSTSSVVEVERMRYEASDASQRHSLEALDRYVDGTMKKLESHLASENASRNTISRDLGREPSEVAE